MEPATHKPINKKAKIAKRLAIFIGSLAVVTVGAIGSFIVLSLANNNSTAVTDSNYTSKTLETGQPDYSVVVPDNKNINDLGGWKRVSPEGSAPVYAFADTIDGINIAISQQALPDEFKTNTAKEIEDLAKSFDASEILTIDNMSVYIGTSAKGPQSVIFSKNNLLILIKSTSKISNSSWASYIRSLK